jgi:hypothetical protein
LKTKTTRGSEISCRFFQFTIIRNFAMSGIFPTFLTAFLRSFPTRYKFAAATSSPNSTNSEDPKVFIASNRNGTLVPFFKTAVRWFSVDYGNLRVMKPASWRNDPALFFHLSLNQQPRPFLPLIHQGRCHHQQALWHQSLGAVARRTTFASPRWKTASARSLSDWHVRDMVWLGLRDISGETTVFSLKCRSYSEIADGVHLVITAGSI